jgi:hypothetical protein
MNYDIEEYKGYKIIIDYDQEPMNPRTEWDNRSTMVCWHSRYNLGDLENRRPISENYREPIDLLYELAGVDRDEYQDEQYEKTGKWDDMDTADLYKLIEEKGTIISTLYLYDHSGITISMGSFSCPWDSGPVGYIYMTKETVLKEWGEGEEAYERARNCMKGEVEVYDNYLTGEVYSFKIEDPDGEEIDSCSGYYGNDGKEDMIKECQNTIDYYIKKKEERNLLLGIQMELAL